MISHPSRGQSGFTLVELMLTIIILVVGILGLASSMASMTTHQELSAARTDMSGLADSKLEQLRAIAASRTADTVQLVVGGSLTVPTANHVDTLQERGRTYLRLWLVAAGAGGSRSVTLRVRPLVDGVKTPSQLDFPTLIHAP
jgi:prepilin-type N-terminal cleavage/methylation domain-containing protein